MLKSLQSICGIVDRVSLNLLLRMGMFPLKHGKVKELHMRRHRSENIEFPLLGQSRTMFLTANGFALSSLFSIFSDCKGMLNARIPVMKACLDVCVVRMQGLVLIAMMITKQKWSKHPRLEQTRQSRGAGWP